MGLDGAFADKEFFGDLAIAQAVGNQLEDLQLAARNAEFGQSLLVQSKELRRGDLPNDDVSLFLVDYPSHKCLSKIKQQPKWSIPRKFSA
jgi:hypothetical protein